LGLFFQIASFNPTAMLGANSDWLCLALNWVCFFATSKHGILHNHLSYKTLRHFHPNEIGFVFSNYSCWKTTGFTIWSSIFCFIQSPESLINNK